jgi:hypothetical protein
VILPQNGNIDQWKRIKNSKVNLHCCSFTLIKVPKTYVEEKMISSANGAGQMGFPQVEN